MLCSVCHQHIDDASAYCPYCGAKITEIVNQAAIAFKNGDQSAFDTLYAGTKGWVTKKIATTTGLSPEDVEDAVQNTYLKAYTSIDKFNPRKSSFFTWITVLASQCGIDKYRSNNTRSSYTLLLDQDIAGTDGTVSYTESLVDQEDMVDRVELREDIRITLRNYTAEEKTIIWMKSVGYQNSDIATLLGMTLTNVKQKIHRMQKRAQQDQAEMSKKHTLRSVAPLGFLTWMIYMNEPVVPSDAAVWAGIQEGIAGLSAGSAAAGIASASVGASEVAEAATTAAGAASAGASVAGASAAGAGAAKGVIGGLIAKFAASSIGVKASAIAAAAVLIGGGAATVNTIQARQNERPAIVTSSEETNEGSDSSIDNLLLDPSSTPVTTRGARSSSEMPGESSSLNDEAETEGIESVSDDNSEKSEPGSGFEDSGDGKTGASSEGETDKTKEDPSEAESEEDETEPTLPVAEENDEKASGTDGGNQKETTKSVQSKEQTSSAASSSSRSSSAASSSAQATDPAGTTASTDGSEKQITESEATTASESTTESTAETEAAFQASIAYSTSVSGTTATVTFTVTANKPCNISILSANNEAWQTVSYSMDEAGSKAFTRTIYKNGGLVIPLRFATVTATSADGDVVSLAPCTFYLNSSDMTVTTVNEGQPALSGNIVITGYFEDNGDGTYTPYYERAITMNQQGQYSVYYTSGTSNIGAVEKVYDFDGGTYNRKTAAHAPTTGMTSGTYEYAFHDLWIESYTGERINIPGITLVYDLDNHTVSTK